MTHKQAYIYTFTIFALICLLSYAASAQPRQISLREALSLTLTHNREIKVASLDVEHAAQQAVVAKSAQLPSAGFSAQVAHYFQSPAFFGFGTSGVANDKIPYGRFGGKDQLAGTLYISQPLYNASSRPGIRQAELQERKSRLDLTYTQTELAALLKQTYIQVLVLRERVKLQQESLARNQRALMDAKSLLAQGRALRVDTLRAFTSVKNLEPGILRLNNAIDVGKQQLKTIIGIDSLQEIELSDSLELPSTVDLPSEAQVYEQASTTRADLRAQDMQQQVAEQQVKLSAASLKPSVLLNAQYLLQTQTSQFNYLSAYYPSTPFVGALVTVPIFTGYAGRAKIRQAKIEQEQAVVRSVNAYQQLKIAVKQVVGNLRETAARIQTSANVKETAALSYDITQYRYSRGVATRLELTDAELALTTAQSNYLEAVYDFLAARIALDKTIGIAE